MIFWTITSRGETPQAHNKLGIHGGKTLARPAPTAEPGRPGSLRLEGERVPNRIQMETTFASCFMAGGTLAAPSLDQALERLRSDDAWGEVRLCLRSKLTKQQLLKLAEALRKVGPIPSDVAAQLVHSIQTFLASEVEILSPSEPEPHNILQLLQRCLAVEGAIAAVEVVEGLVPLLATWLKRSKLLQSSSQAMMCLQRLSEQQTSSVKACSQQLAAGIMPAIQVLSDVVQQHRTSRGVLREAVNLLQALPPVLEMTSHLEASALPALASLQPLAVLGAPYVLPGRARPPPGLAGLAPRDPSDCSWSETDASATERVKGKGRGEGKDSSKVEPLQIQLRALALRNFAQLFRLWPKAFFGRWPLVLDFQSGEVCRPTGKPLPMLLSICEQDPAPKVRTAALSALLALLQAPQLRTWPVPLEAAKTQQSSTSLTGQLAVTIRQSHALVMELIDRDELTQLNALRACSDLATCTPYTKLHSGLLTSLLHKLLTFLSLADLKLEASAQALAAVMAIGSVLKRDDCSSELTQYLFVTAKPPADWLLQQMLDLMAELQRNQLRPPTPSADKREGGKNSRKGKAEKTEAEEPVLIQEFALLTGRLATFVPSAVPESTIGLLEKLITMLVTYHSSMLRLRGFRLLSDLPAVSSIDWRFSQQFLEDLLHAAQRLETNASVRAAAMSALPCLVRAEGFRCSKALEALYPKLEDNNGGVRTAAVQALGALTGTFSHVEGKEVICRVLPLAADSAGDVRSACATALASFAPLLTSDELQRENVARALMPLCSDPSDKARASGLRAVGCVAELGLKPGQIQDLADLLTVAVQKPPPKCQWNGCRSAGQLAAAASYPEVVTKLMEALCDLLRTENLKVRIQAALALKQVAALPGRAEEKERISQAASEASEVSSLGLTDSVAILFCAE